MSKALTVSQKGRCGRLTEKRWEMLDAATGSPVVIVSHRWELSFRSTNATVLYDTFKEFISELSADTAKLKMGLVIGK